MGRSHSCWKRCVLTALRTFAERKRTRIHRSAASGEPAASPDEICDSTCAAATAPLYIFQIASAARCAIKTPLAGRVRKTEED